MTLAALTCRPVRLFERPLLDTANTVHLRSTQWSVALKLGPTPQPDAGAVVLVLTRRVRSLPLRTRQLGFPRRAAPVLGRPLDVRLAPRVDLISVQNVLHHARVEHVKCDRSSTAQLHGARAKARQPAIGQPPTAFSRRNAQNVFNFT